MLKLSGNATDSWPRHWGSCGASGDNSFTGAAYVFRRDAAGAWSQEAYIKASNPGEHDALGEALSLAANGHTLAAAARGEDSNSTGVARPKIVTITFNVERSSLTSSTFPVKLMSESSANSSCVCLTRSVPLRLSSPMDINPTRGFSMPITFSA